MLPGMHLAQRQQLVSLAGWSPRPAGQESFAKTFGAPRNRAHRQPPPPAASPSLAATTTNVAVPPLPLSFHPDYYDTAGRLMLKCLTMAELEAWCGSVGEDPARRAMQLWRFMYCDRAWLRSLEEAPAAGVQNGFSAAFLEKVSGVATIDGGLELVAQQASADGTRKLVFRLTCGPGAGGQVETVIIPIVREAGSKRRVTLCVSSQVGCAQGCQFCFTSKMGLLGNLTPAQVVEQVVAARRLLWEEATTRGEDPQRHVTPITNVVYMGMGEPLDNLPAVLPSLDIMTHPMGLHLSHNKVCVSTVGLVPQMRRLAAASRAALAVSLHATTDDTRSAIVPTNRRHPLPELMAALEELFPKDAAAPRHGHHVLIEYVMLRGVNDTPEDAERLLELTKRVRCKVNLIAFNPHDGTRFQAAFAEDVAAFRSVLIRGGCVATVRASRGDDEMAACGQLGSPGQRKERAAPAGVAT